MSLWDIFKLKETMLHVDSHGRATVNREKFAKSETVRETFRIMREEAPLQRKKAPPTDSGRVEEQVHQDHR